MYFFVITINNKVHKKILEDMIVFFFWRCGIVWLHDLQ